jgi:cyclic pyranopterin phosphate synthase
MAEIAGIMGGKMTSSLIPLCHPLQITKLSVKAVLDDDGIVVKSYASCIGKTGIEMESLTSVSIALLAVYDMCKSADKNMTIGPIRLLEKTKTDL